MTSRNYRQQRQTWGTVLVEVVRIVYALGTMPELSDPLRIEPAKPGQRQKALQLLQLGPAHIERLLSAAFSGEVDMDGLFLARRGDQLVGAARGQPTPGNLAFCWPPQITNDEPEQTAQMLQAAVDHPRLRGTGLSQAILPPSDILHALRLSRAGYKHLADLAYLVSEQETFPTSEPTGELTFTTSPRDDDSRIRHVIEHSYINTLDCPELEQLATSTMSCSAIAAPESIGLTGGLSLGTWSRMLDAYWSQIIPNTSNAN